MTAFELLGYRSRTEDLALPVMLPGHIMMILLAMGQSPYAEAHPPADPFTPGPDDDDADDDSTAPTGNQGGAAAGSASAGNP